jgi:FkbM family methyltransferase
MDSIIWLHRHLQRAVDIMQIRPLARRCFRAMLAWRGGPNGSLLSATQNGRQWRLLPEVALRGEFQEYETVEWLRQVIQPGMCVFDIGANVGQMTLEMAALVGPSGQVVAVEPAPGNLAVLRRHVEGNGFSGRVKIVAAACSEKSNEVIPMKIFGNSEDAVGSGHTLVVMQAEPTAASTMPFAIIMVKTVTVDSLCDHFGLLPDVLKIDVEGAEIAVLRGARCTLRERRPQIRFGFHPFVFIDPILASSELRHLLTGCNYVLEPGTPATLELAEYNASPVTPLSHA